jgi:hypothetical protein
MPSPAETCVAAAFHLMRSIGKAKPVGEPPAWMIERAEREYLAHIADWVAEIDARERSWG